MEVGSLVVKRTFEGGKILGPVTTRDAHAALATTVRERVCGQRWIACPRQRTSLRTGNGRGGGATRSQEND